MPLQSQHLTIRSGRLPQSNIKRRYLLTYAFAASTSTSSTERATTYFAGFSPTASA